MAFKDAESPHDPIEIMCSEMSHLSKEQFKEAKEILENYRDVFTVSNTKIGRTNCMNFDINTDPMSPNFHTSSPSAPTPARNCERAFRPLP